jgi:tRNA pseudouridine38-40 synthase
MPRYKLTIEYDGSPFVGWQAQANGLSVQHVLEAGFKGFCGQDIKVNGAGRTDAGVHALGQVAHVDLPREAACDTLRDAVNAHMRPHPVAIVEAEAVPDTFEARFSAVKRHYMYRIVNRRAPLTLDRGRHGSFTSRSMRRRCTMRRRRWSAATTSRPSAPSSARRNRR